MDFFDKGWYTTTEAEMSTKPWKILEIFAEVNVFMFLLFKYMAQL